jgi:hypothetical protein
MEQSEDCLYLNVYTPAKNTTDLLPVFVSIHGGAITVGSSRRPDMTCFVQNSVVGVSIAYWLGELRFMAHLKADGSKTIDTFTATDVTINGTKFTQAAVTYTGLLGTYESLIIGLVKNGKWVIIEVYTFPSAFPFTTPGQKAAIISTVKFQ